MDERLKILLLEDSTDDAELLQRLLKKERPGCEFSVAMSKDIFLQELDHYKPDLILADNSMPQFSSADALEIVRKRKELVPFILITGTVSEEFAANIIKQGADDYFLKDRLTRLPSAIDSAIKQRRLEKDRIESQQNLKAAHDRLLFHVENAPLGFIEWDNQFKIKTWSKRAEEIFGWTEAEYGELQQNGSKWVFDEDKEWVNKVSDKLMSGEIRSNNIRYRNNTKDGKVIWCEWFNSVLTDGDGKVITIMSLVMDVTGRMQAEEAIRKSEEKYRTLVEQAFDGIIIYSPDGSVIDFNDSAFEYMGYTKEEFAGLNVMDLFFKDDLESNPLDFEELIVGGSTIDYRKLKRKDGSFIEVEIATKMMPGGNYMAIARDITERKEAESRKEFDSNNLKALINNTNDLMWSIDCDYKLITSNNTFNKTYLPNGRIHSPGDENQALPSKQVRTFKKYYDRALAGETFSEVVYTASPESWSEISFYPIRNGDEVIGTACYARDVSERIKASKALHHMEQEILNQKVQEQKKITRAILNAQEKERNHIGQELHDNINQILAGAKLYLSVAGKRNEPLKASLTYPMELIDNAMHEIRLLSSHQVTPIKNVDLQDTVELLLNNLQESSTIKTTLKYRIDTEAINDDVKLNIYRIIQELVNNIVKHAAASVIEVMIEKDQENINLTVKDDGKGFDIYKKRTGVGISNMINRIESFNGKILIQSSPGSGCQVEVSIPYQLSDQPN